MGIPVFTACFFLFELFKGHNSRVFQARRADEHSRLCRTPRRFIILQFCPCPPSAPLSACLHNSYELHRSLSSLQHATLTARRPSHLSRVLILQEHSKQYLPTALLLKPEDNTTTPPRSSSSSGPSPRQREVELLFCCCY